MPGGKEAGGKASGSKEQDVTASNAPLKTLFRMVRDGFISSKCPMEGATDAQIADALRTMRATDANIADALRKLKIVKEKEVRNQVNLSRGYM
jgi:hypothetical protein